MQRHPDCLLLAESDRLESSGELAGGMPDANVAAWAYENGEEKWRRT